MVGGYHIMIDTMKEKNYDQAVACVKDYVLPAKIKLFQSCDGNLDKVYGKTMEVDNVSIY